MSLVYTCYVICHCLVKIRKNHSKKKLEFNDSRWNWIDLVWMILFNFMMFKFQDVLIPVCIDLLF